MKVKVNDIEIDLKPGTSAMDAVFAAGYDVPYFCSQAYMSPIGACRMCLARVGAPRKDRDSGEWIADDATGEPKIFYFPTLMATCTTAIMEGMVVDTLSDDVKRAQDSMVEFTLINHPLDCPVCDKGGACELQDRAYEYGSGLSRFVFDKRHQEKHAALSPLITLDRERCIHCKRCVRYFEEIPGDEILDFIERGGHTYIGTIENGLPSNFTGNITDICPVGALLDKTSRFRGRNWEYHHTRTTCLDCPVGCGAIVDARTGRIERIKAGRNPHVNNDWICDGGRFGHEYVDSPERLQVPLIRRDGELTQATWEDAASFIWQRLDSLGEKDLGIAVRADVTLEEGVAAKALAQQVGTGQLDHFPRPAGSLVPQQAQATLADVAVADAILVFGDLTEEAPIVDLRIKDALKGVAPPELLPHGAPIADLRLKERMPRNHEQLAVLAPYRVDLMRHAGLSAAYAPGREVELLQALAQLSGAEADGGAVEGHGVDAGVLEEIGRRLNLAKRAVIVAGGFVTASATATGALNGFVKQVGAKLMTVGPMANSYGLEAIGVLPSHARYSYRRMLSGSAKALLVSGLNPAIDDEVARSLRKLALLVVHDSFPTETTALADVVLPAKTGYEKVGTVINLEGRCLPVAPAPVEAGLSEDFTGLVKRLGEVRGTRMEGRSLRSARRVLKRALGLELAELPEHGALSTLRSRGAARAAIRESETPMRGNLLLTPSMLRVEQLHRNPHLLKAHGPVALKLHPSDAAQLGVNNGDAVSIKVAGVTRNAVAEVSEDTAAGVMLLPALPDQPVGLVPVDTAGIKVSHDTVTASP